NGKPGAGTQGRVPAPAALSKVSVAIPAAVPAVVVLVANRFGHVRIRKDLERHVVAVLLGVEHAPGAVERPRLFGAEDSVRRRVAVGHVNPGDLVVAVVLEPRGS